MQIPNGPRQPIAQASGAQLPSQCGSCGYRFHAGAQYGVVPITGWDGQPARAVQCPGCSQLLQISQEGIRS